MVNLGVDVFAVIGLPNVQTYYQSLIMLKRCKSTYLRQATKLPNLTKSDIVNFKHEDLSNELEVNLDPNVLSKIMQAQIDRGDARDPSLDICTVRTMEVLQAEDQEASLLVQVKEWKLNEDNNLILIQMFE